MENTQEPEHNKPLDFDDLIQDVSEAKYKDEVISFIVITHYESGGTELSIYQKDAKKNRLFVNTLLGCIEMTKAQILDDYLNQLYDDNFNSNEDNESDNN
jgi:hypothetical protein